MTWTTPAQGSPAVLVAIEFGDISVTVTSVVVAMTVGDSTKVRVACHPSWVLGISKLQQMLDTHPTASACFPCTKSGYQLALRHALRAADTLADAAAQKLERMMKYREILQHGLLDLRTFVTIQTITPS